MAGIDANTKLYLKFAEGPDEATDCSDFSPSNHNPTFVGTAKLDSAQKLSAGGYSGDVTSLLLDGNSDYVLLSDSTDWDLLNSTENSVSFDCWIRPAAVNSQYFIFMHQGAAYWYVDKNSQTIRLRDTGSRTQISTGNVITSANTWYHIAIIRVAADIGIYVNGTQGAYKQLASTYNTGTTGLSIGADPLDLANSFNGYMAHVRVQHSNIFGASPNSGLTNTITVPTAPYSTASASTWKPKIIMY